LARSADGDAYPSVTPETSVRRVAQTGAPGCAALAMLTRGDQPTRHVTFYFRRRDNLEPWTMPPTRPALVKDLYCSIDASAKLVIHLPFSHVYLPAKNVNRCRNHRIRERLSESHDLGRRQFMAKGNSTSNRGFASMDEERQREIASKGGRSVPAEKRSFSQDRELASEAGRKGGQASGGTRSSQE
jgi:uncharacterized protein